MRIDVTILGAASLLALTLGGGVTATQQIRFAPVPASTTGPGAEYAGVWLSADDAVRLDLSADLTYERSVVGRRASASGTYTVDGHRLLLRDADGLRTTVTSKGGHLELAGYLLSRI